MTEIDHIEFWKMKKLIKNLSELRGNGTSMITLAMPPDKSLSYVTSMLTTEYGTATNIKSRVNRLSVLGAISSTQTKLKQYKSIPENGLVIYCGTVMLEGNKEKKITHAIEPLKPIKQFLYLCDSRFHTEVLESILQADDKYGFIIVDGNGALLATVYGNEQNILHQFTVDLPKKHGRGGQSALRFSRLRVEARNNYIRKVGELSTHYFIENDLPNVKGLVIGGSADLKNELIDSQHFDQRLKPKILSVVDISYGGKNGFNQAIELSADALSNVKLLEEKKLLEEYYYELTTDSGKYCFGIKQTIEALDAGAVEKLIIWEDLPLKRYTFTNAKGEEVIDYSNKDGFVKEKHQLKNVEDWVDWISEHYMEFGTGLNYVTDRSSEGTQFVKGFGGIGCILRWAMKFQDEYIVDNEINSDVDNNQSDNDDFDIDDFF